MTVTDSVSSPFVPDVKVIAGVVAPYVIVPFVIVQAYVAPATAEIEAERPAFSDATVPGTVITGVEGFALTTTVVLRAASVHPPTVILSQ